MKRLKIRIKHSGKMPQYKTEQAAGCDLINAGETIVLPPLERAFLHTGVQIELPDGYEAQVRGRSGLNKNYGIVVPVGTIDADYRGEIGVVVYNLSREPYTIQHGERIAQLIISPVIRAAWEETNLLADTDRGIDGFGSTGKL